ncbi:hypothetical protein [Pseudomonas sp. UMAB-40]|uniref:hypothetical protein n=1 Tax=Pseudomonas sp. UMAB-40 TaxID=1365407 RepID=UPI001C59752C|nr:hypothetical protein [Pseudomonas sp. UMAB-40]
MAKHAVLSKTTLNFAERHGYSLEFDSSDDVISVFEGDNDCEPLFTIQHCNGEFFYRGNIYLPEEIKVELPHWMPDELRLRRVIAFVASARKA